MFSGWDATASMYAICTMSSDGSNRQSVTAPSTMQSHPSFPPRMFAYEILWVDDVEIVAITEGWQCGIAVGAVVALGFALARSSEGPHC